MEIRTMTKCMYKCQDGMCACSTSAHHCKQVDDTICEDCLSNQDEPTVSDKVKLKRVITKAINMIEEGNDYEASVILRKALNI